MKIPQQTTEIGLSKRHKIIITSLLLTLGFLFITHTANVVFRRYYLILVLGLLVYGFSLWSLRKGMTKTKAVVLMILPIFYCIAVPSFYFLFREIRWLTRLPAAIFFGLSFYCLLLTQNVFNVASDRTIPLYRAASAVSFVFTILTSILLSSVIFAFNLPFYWNGFLIFLVSFPLILQILWTVRVEKVDTQILVFTAIISLLLAEAAIALSFWSVSPFVRSLLLNTVSYVTLGVLLDYMHEKITKRAVWEYVGVGGGIFLFILILTSFFLF